MELQGGTGTAAVVVHSKHHHVFYSSLCLEMVLTQVQINSVCNYVAAVQLLLVFISTYVSYFRNQIFS